MAWMQTGVYVNVCVYVYRSIHIYYCTHLLNFSAPHASYLQPNCMLQWSRVIGAQPICLYIFPTSPQLQSRHLLLCLAPPSRYPPHTTLFFNPFLFLRVSRVASWQRVPVAGTTPVCHAKFCVWKLQQQQQHQRLTAWLAVCAVG